MNGKTMTRVNRAVWAVALASALCGAAVIARGASPAVSPAITRTPAADVKYQPLDPHDKTGKGPQIAMVFGDMQKKAPVGFLFKVPPGFRPGPHTHTLDYHSVVLEGVVHDFAPGADEGPAIGPGGFWFQRGRVPHDNHCASPTPCVIFIYSPLGYDYLPLTTDAARHSPKSL